MVFFLYHVILDLQSSFEETLRKEINTMLDENIRIMRREKGLTQEQLAEVMGVSTASVSKWETGVAVPELGMLAALADFFEVSIDALIGHTVGKVQLKEKTAAIKELSLAGEDEKAIEQAEELLRRYPNEYDVASCASDAYYTAYIHNRNKEYIHRCMELIHRKYALSKDNSGKKWFEMQRELANCQELLGEWKSAKDYYEESNVAGLNDANIARCLARMEENDAAVDQFSSAIENKVFTLVSDLMQLANLWVATEDNAKAISTYQAALAVLESFNSQMDLKVMKLSCHFALACLENEEGNPEAAKEQIRLAVRTEMGKDVAENNNVTFLQAEKPHQLIHTAFEGSQVIQMLTAMGEEELLAVAQEELGK